MIFLRSYDQLTNSISDLLTGRRCLRRRWRRPRTGAAAGRSSAPPPSRSGAAGTPRQRWSSSGKNKEFGECSGGDQNVILFYPCVHMNTSRFIGQLTSAKRAIRHTIHLLDSHFCVRFSWMFSKIYTGDWAGMQLTCCPWDQEELSENIPWNPPHKLLPCTAGLSIIFAAKCHYGLLKVTKCLRQIF